MKRETFNGVCSEIISATITYPLNTIKTNSQIGKIIKPTIRNLYKGYKWCLITELTSAFIFYSIFENLKKNRGALHGSILASGAAISVSHPLNTRRKLMQIGKQGNFTYKGVGVGLFNGVPGNAINFTLKEIFSEKYNSHPLCGIVSSAISIFITHPLDTLSTCVSTGCPYKNNTLFRGFRQRFLEKNLTIGSKMLLLGILNNN